MIEHLGTFFEIGKMVKDYFTWKEETKLVDMLWLEKSGFGERLRNKGYKCRWSNSDRVETRKLDGYEIIYEIDEKSKTKKKITNKSGQILIGKSLK